MVARPEPRARDRPMSHRDHKPPDDFDHGILSPSGHVSKRARDATIAQLALAVNRAVAEAELAHQGYLEAKRPEFLRQKAADLRALAARGMQPRKLTAQAARLEAEADALETG